MFGLTDFSRAWLLPCCCFVVCAGQSRAQHNGLHVLRVLRETVHNRTRRCGKRGRVDRELSGESTDFLVPPWLPHHGHV